MLERDLFQIYFFLLVTKRTGLGRSLLQWRPQGIKTGAATCAANRGQGEAVRENQLSLAVASGLRFCTLGKNSLSVQKGRAGLVALSWCPQHHAAQLIASA